VTTSGPWSSIFWPVIIQNALQSCRIFTDSAASFACNIVDRLDRIASASPRTSPDSLTLVTASNPRIGYDEAVRIGKLALAENITLKQAAERLGYVRPEDFDRRGVPAAMTEPGVTLPGGGG
jgi:fumarate hydratase class II